LSALLILLAGHAGTSANTRSTIPTRNQLSETLAPETTFDPEALAHAGFIAWDRDQPERVAVDTETEGFEFFDEPFCVTVAWEGEKHYFELSGDTPSVLQEALSGTPSWVFHNAKFDLQKLCLVGVCDLLEITPDRFEDTAILSYLGNEHRKHALKALAADLLGEETDEEEALKVVRRKLKLRKDDGYHVLPRDVLVPYALKDAEFTWRLFPILMGQLLAKNDPQLLELYRLEKELALVLLSMETAGLAVDLDYVDKTAREYGTRAIATEMHIRDLTGQEEFNPQSNPQIREAFLARGIEREKYDKHVLKELDDPLAQAILDLRGTKKMHGTYLVPIQREQRNGVLHPNFRMNRTKTGRLASGGAEE
jgi:DNA polymerase I-like protein with 3'-5' exonuclease and polymerase domains